MFQMSARACDIWRMEDSPHLTNLRTRLRVIMERKGIRPTTLSSKVGDSPTLVKDLLEKTKDAKLSTIYKLAEALGVAPTDLLEGDLDSIPVGPRLFVKGEVAAGQWCDAVEWPEPDWQPMIGSPELGSSVDHRFFLKVKGGSMNLIYPEGSYIECISVFGRAEVRPGKRVVVMRRRDDQLVEATVKELVEIDGSLWLVPRSTNPDHQAYRMDAPGDGIEEVMISAVVVSSVRPE